MSLSSPMQTHGKGAHLNNVGEEEEGRTDPKHGNLRLCCLDLPPVRVSPLLGVKALTSWSHTPLCKRNFHGAGPSIRAGQQDIQGQSLLPSL